MADQTFQDYKELLAAYVALEQTNRNQLVDFRNLSAMHKEALGQLEACKREIAQLRLLTPSESQETLDDAK